MKLHPRNLFKRDADLPLVSDMTFGQYLGCLMAVGIVSMTIVMLLVSGCLALVDTL